MQTWRQALKEGIKSGTIAAVLSTAALTILGFVERRRPAAANNAPSQWVWGRHAAYRTNATARHTIIGYLVHHAMSVFWAAIHEKIFGDNAQIKSAGSDWSGFGNGSNSLLR